MIEHLDSIAHRYRFGLRFVFVSILIIGNLFLLSYLLSNIEIASAQAGDEQAADDATVSSTYDSPNVVTSGMALAGAKLGKFTHSAAGSLNDGVQTTTSMVAQTGSFAVASGKFVVRSAYTGVASIARGVGTIVTFTSLRAGRTVVSVASIPGTVVSSLTKAPAIGAVIRPADHEEVPIIDPNSPALLAAMQAMPAQQVEQAASQSQPVPQSNSAAAWPIHGAITTLFGVNHWPYQATHSGIDISDGKPSGVTPVKPFRPGKVIDATRSSRGLGNYVSIDHGSGVTSVYAHLSSISVQPGQEVGMDTSLGFQGTTGVSTGTHLHFEIRVNGQAADPQKFISGQP